MLCAETIQFLRNFGRGWRRSVARRYICRHKRAMRVRQMMAGGDRSSASRTAGVQAYSRSFRDGDRDRYGGHWCLEPVAAAPKVEGNKCSGRQHLVDLETLAILITDTTSLKHTVFS